MTRLASATLAAALLASTAIAPAFAQDNTTQNNTLRTGAYGGLSFGALMPEDTDGPNGSEVERDTGYAIFGQYGYRFPNQLRLEAELGYGNSEYDRFRAGGASSGLGDDTDMYSLTGAAYYDFATGTPLTPYLGGGAGLVHQRFDRSTAGAGGTTLAGNDGSSTDLTAFGEVGLSYQLSSSLELVPSYRYQWINDGEQGLDDTTMHIARIGLRTWF
ncbi:MAG: outer membrane protein [Ferrovibrio sp.]|jgi:opacity protein-like surface antigen|uniref:outer membrane protein n=1 Tax=Ferrovibrio sp. TaxID=1917215 RepID=UPI00391A577A